MFWIGVHTSPWGGLEAEQTEPGDWQYPVRLVQNRSILTISDLARDLTICWRNTSRWTSNINIIPSQANSKHIYSDNVGRDGYLGEGGYQYE